MNTLNSIIRGREVYSLKQEMTVLEAARYMSEKRVGAAAVLDGERVVGVFSERDLMTRVVVPGVPAERTRLADVMTRDIVVSAPHDTLEEGLRKMQQAKCRHLPVVQDSRLLGFISLRDLLQVELEEKDEENRFLNEYIHSIPASAGK